MIKLVVFDFDGVIVDSAHECFVLCKETAKRLGWKPIDKFEKQFVQARAFVQNAEDYYYITRSFNEGLKIDFSEISQEEFNSLKSKLSGDVKSFVDLFYKIRYQIQIKDIQKWYKLHKVYPGIKRAFKQISKKYPIAIATTKDRKSAGDLLDSIGLEIKEENITGRELAHDKVSQLKALSKKFKVKPAEIFFIEDMLQNLKPALATGVKGCLVFWGYSNKAQKTEAKKLGILLNKPEEIIQKIKNCS